mgnify:CR=1 FL=1
MQVLLSIESGFNAAEMAPIMLFLEQLRRARFPEHAEHQLNIRCYPHGPFRQLQLEWSSLQWLSTAMHALFVGQIYANVGLQARVQVQTPLTIDFHSDHAKALGESYALDSEGFAKIVQAIGGVLPS